MDQAAIKWVAEAMISVFGSNALAEARKRATEALDAGDTEGFRGWQAIMAFAKAVLRPQAAK